MVWICAEVGGGVQFTPSPNRKTTNQGSPDNVYQTRSWPNKTHAHTRNSCCTQFQLVVLTVTIWFCRHHRFKATPGNLPLPCHRVSLCAFSWPDLAILWEPSRFCKKLPASCGFLTSSYPGLPSRLFSRFSYHCCLSCFSVSGLFPWFTLQFKRRPSPASRIRKPPRAEKKRCDETRQPCTPAKFHSIGRPHTLCHRLFRAP